MAALAARSASVDVYEDLPFPTTGTVTVSAVNSAGSTVAPGVSAAYSTDEAEWHATLTAAHTATPGLLTLTWTHSGGSSATTTVDVRNGNPFPSSTLAKVLAKGGDLDDYTEPARKRALEAALIDLEDACGVALVTQRSTETLAGTGSTFVSRYYAVQRAIDPADAAVTSSGVVTLTSSQTNPTVTLEHGLPELGRKGQRAVALLASSWLADGPWDDRGVAVSGDGGPMIRLMQAGVGGTRYPIPEVQEFYRRNRQVTVR